MRKSNFFRHKNTRTKGEYIFFRQKNIKTKEDIGIEGLIKTVFLDKRTQRQKGNIFFWTEEHKDIRGYGNRRFDKGCYSVCL